MPPIASPKRLPPFWRGAILSMALGIPLAVGVRAWKSAAKPTGHSHGGDNELKSALFAAEGAERIALLRNNVESPDRMRRLSVSEQLEEEKGPEFVPLAELALHDNDSEVRRHAARSIARNPAPASAPLMRAVLQDDDLWVRQEALQTVATGVAAPHGPWLVGDLIPLLDDPQPTMRYLAALGLKRRTGKAWRYYVRSTPEEIARVQMQWKTWWAGAKTSFGRPPSVPPLDIRRTEPAPEATIRTIDGKTFSPASDKRITLVYFWGTWCAPCQEEILELQRVHEKCASANVQVLGVALSEPEGEAGLRAYGKKHGLTFPQSLAEDAVTEAYGDVIEIPVTVLVDAHGKIRYRWRGERDYASFARAVERLRSER